MTIHQIHKIINVELKVHCSLNVCTCIITLCYNASGIKLC